MANAILAIDQGTTSSRAIVFSAQGKILAQAQEEFPQLYPAEGQVEHDPEAIWNSVLQTARTALQQAEDGGHRVLGIGITNQRETIVLWDRKTGKPLHNAIVWQDRRTSAYCRSLEKKGHGPLVAERAGLVLDPYFSASKLNYLLEQAPKVRQAAEAGRLAAGTIDSFLLYRLTGGKVHATDATNACRTSLFGLKAQDWDTDLLSLFDIPRAVLPEVHDCAHHFGDTDPSLFGRALPILAMIGDQQAATVGQACFRPGDMKSTYGTGCFVLANTGTDIKRSAHRLLSTVAYRVGGEATFALEGSIFIAGAAVQWLRDELRLLSNAAETAERAERARDDARVVMVPAFAGMGAPHWEADARAAVFGMTRATGPDELARAALEGVVFQTGDLMEAMRGDGLSVQRLKVDGGMAANNWFVQRLSDLLDLPVTRPAVLETTALGAASMAFLEEGTFGSLSDIASQAEADRSFTPRLEPSERKQLQARWSVCVEAVKAVAAAG